MRATTGKRYVTNVDTGNTEEIRLGAEKSKPREKFTRVPDMLAVLESP